MSTQGFYGYKSDNKIKGLQLYQDAYPAYPGKQIVSLIQHYSDAEIRSFWLDQIILLDDFSVNDYQELDIDELKNQYDRIFLVKPKKLIWLYKIFNLSQESRKEYHYFADGNDFYKNGIFCSYSYILDFDNLKLVVFSCYNSTPEKGLENWYQEDINGKLFYMNTLFTITFDEVRKSKIETILSKIEMAEKKDTVNINKLDL